MQLFYDTREPGHFTFNVAPTPDQVPKGARVSATCFDKSGSETLDEHTFHAMTGGEYCELPVLVRQAREREQRQAKEGFWKRLFHSLFGLILAAVACACLATAASAATFQVTTTADNGDHVSPTPGSLRKE